MSLLQPHRHLFDDIAASETVACITQIKSYLQAKLSNFQNQYQFDFHSERPSLVPNSNRSSINWSPLQAASLGLQSQFENYPKQEMPFEVEKRHNNHIPTSISSQFRNRKSVGLISDQSQAFDQSPQLSLENRPTIVEFGTDITPKQYASPDYNFDCAKQELFNFASPSQRSSLEYTNNNTPVLSIEKEKYDQILCEQQETKEIKQGRLSRGGVYWNCVETLNSCVTQENFVEFSETENMYLQTIALFN